MKISKKLTNREERISFLYKFFLFNWSFNDVTNNLKNNDIFTQQEEEAILYIVENSNSLISLIKEKITIDWSWERINNLEKAILLNGAAEILLFLNKPSIVINESVNYAKQFSQLEAPSLVNAILDKISKK